jgi:hypothetical protein
MKSSTSTLANLCGREASRGSSGRAMFARSSDDVMPKVVP